MILLDSPNGYSETPMSLPTEGCLSTSRGLRGTFDNCGSKIERNKFRMTDEFRIQHLASVIQKSLKTSIKPDVIAKEFSDNKTPFVTAQVSRFPLMVLRPYSGTKKLHSR